MNNEPFDWEWMWTTLSNEYVLCDFSDSERERYTIMHLPTLKLIIIEDNASFRTAIAKMKQAGNRIITHKEVWVLMGRDPADLP